MMKFYLTFLLVQICVFAQAQPELRMPKVPINRQLFHFKIDEAQQKILHLHSNKDSVLKVSTDESINLQTHQILTTRINNLQAKIELDSTISENDKIIWLRSIENLLSDFTSYSKLKAIKDILLGDLILAYDQCMKLQLRQKSIYPIIVANELEIGNILTSNIALKNNIGLRAAKDELVLKLCRKYPQRILKILQENVNVPFADRDRKSVV